MNNSNTDTEIFDVFLCHNTEDKDEIRGMADKLINRQIKPWLDEREIRPGTSWQDALEEQIELVNSAAVFVGENGLGPWQRQEIRAFISEFLNRNCPVIPVILQSTIKEPPLPISLKHLEYIDFRKSIPNPLERLIWGITGNKPTHDDLYKQETTIQLELVEGAKKQILEIRVNGNLEDLSPEDIDELIADIKEKININNDIKNTMNRPGSIRLFLELTPEDADKIFDASKNGQLESLGVTHARLYPSLADLPNDEEREQLLILLDRVQEFW
ncbi:MAG: toll/interleukin-1 receptor domain-containing protein, partial [Methylococcaceae bacterium]|nr:toll/interleukin-1 receptor domain-containing protein [Methylococcaceae bacterium]